MFNRLEEPVFALHPELAAAKATVQAGEVLGALLSGSGATVYGLTPGMQAAQAQVGLRASLAFGQLLTCGPYP
jgi:4-diphosphocytidyl-2C-methyl-D-erythritol kinase